MFGVAAAAVSHQLSETAIPKRSWWPLRPGTIRKIAKKNKKTTEANIRNTKMSMTAILAGMDG